MPIPRIAIVGRPNVGKSSLLNMLAKDKVSIVDPTPGVTRDRVCAMIEIEGPLKTESIKMAEIVDTGGYGVYTAQGERYDEIGEDLTKLSGPIEDQIAEAVSNSDLILFVIDAQAGVTALDETIARMLRERAFGGRDRESAPIVVVANKTDSEKWEPHAWEAASLGFGDPIMVSAKTNNNRRVFREALYEALPEVSALTQDDEAQPELKIAIVGKRNAGKSTFVNALAGEERVIVSEIAGTTRDSVDVRFEFDGKSFLAIDTAGVRKKKSYANQIEWFANHRAMRSVHRADVVLLMIDATVPVSQVDKNLGKIIQDEYKPCVIIVNKWDLAEGRRNPKGKPVSPHDYQEYFWKQMKGLRRCPIVFTSAEEGEGLKEAVEIAHELFEQSLQRVPTGKLNRIVRDILKERGPSTKLGSRAKVFYASQVAVQPPTILMVVNSSKLFSPSYERYLLNRLAERTPFEETPIRLIMRDRKRVSLDGLFAGEHLVDKVDFESEDFDEQMKNLDAEMGDEVDESVVEKD